MFVKEFIVLVVDDEPDVLSVTKLAMRKFTMYGLPIVLHTATSKAEAIDVLNSLATQAPGTNQVSVAFIDVVMETDTAGLELCEYIRETLGNRVIQLFVRTGQPGVAPEREVIDRYDINGYVAKVEATEDKLYSLVKSGIRQNYYMNTSSVVSDLLIALISASRSRAGMAQILNYTTAALQSTATGEPGDLVEINMAFMVGDETFAGTWDTPQAREVRDRLMAGTTQSLSLDGDYYAIDGMDFLIRVAPTPGNVELFMVGRGVSTPPEMIIALLHKLSRAVAGLYFLAEDPVPETT